MARAAALSIAAVRTRKQLRRRLKKGSLDDGQFQFTVPRVPAPVALQP